MEAYTSINTHIRFDVKLHRFMLTAATHVALKVPY